MERSYLLKVIEKNFWPLSAEEIAEQLATVPLNLPDFLKEMLKQKDASLCEQENLKNLHPLFCQALLTIEKSYDELAKEAHPNVLRFEKLFDEALLMISIYYQYSAVLHSNVAAEFIRFVLQTKVLLA